MRIILELNKIIPNTDRNNHAYCSILNNLPWTAQDMIILIIMQRTTPRKQLGGCFEISTAQMKKLRAL